MYLVIKNAGLIQDMDLFSMGSSTKRGDETKIGQFGSGNKFAMAYFCRNGLIPTIFSGMNTLEVSIVPIEYRGRMKKYIHVNGINSWIDTDFGEIDWMAWMAVREIFSNAKDEDNEASITLSYKLPPKEEGVTYYCIPCDDGLKTIFDNFSYYFADGREPDDINSRAMAYIKENSSEMTIYRKGIRAFEPTKKHMTLLDFNFNHLSINESRLASESSVDIAGAKYLRECTDVRVIKAAILSQYNDFIPDFEEMTDTFIRAYTELRSDGYNFTTKTLRNLIGTAFNGQRVITIKSTHFHILEKMGIVSNPLAAVTTNIDGILAVNIDGYEDLKIEAYNLARRIIPHINFTLQIVKSNDFRDTKIFQNLRDNTLRIMINTEDSILTRLDSLSLEQAANVIVYHAIYASLGSAISIVASDSIDPSTHNQI